MRVLLGHIKFTAKQAYILSIFLTALLFHPVRASDSGKIKTNYRKQLAVTTTIFEKTKDGKIPVKSFKHVLEKEWAQAFFEYRGMQILYGWIKTTAGDGSSNEKETMKVDALVINVSTKEHVYFADKNILTPKQYVMQKMGAFYFRSLAYRGNYLKVSKTMILNPAGYHHAVLDNVHVFDLNDGFYGVFEIHLKIKQVMEK